MRVLASVGLLVLAACSSSSDDAPVSPTTDPPGTTLPDGTRAPGGETRPDGSTPATPNGEVPGAPAVQFVGRWDRTVAERPRAQWPGTKVVLRFDGTGARIVLSSAAGFSGNASWFNVVVDGAVGTPVVVDGPSEEIAITGLAKGVHVVELDKRVEGKWGTVQFESASIEDGELLAPPVRPVRRIEYFSESTISGFGVDGTNPCPGGDPADKDDARKSVAALTASALSAEYVLLASSGRGVVKNESADTTFLPALYDRALQDVPGSTWDFASWTPDVVVLSLGGTDMAGGTVVPAGFQAAYDTLVTQIRGHYPNAHVFMTVWSQIKGDVRAALTPVLEAIKAAHAGDTRLHVFSFTEALPSVETGCFFHANAAHHAAASAELAAAIEAQTGW